MARKSKTEPEKKAGDPAGSGPAVSNGSETAHTKKKSRPAPSKPRAKKAASSPKNAPPSSPLREPSDDEIRLRAYFLAERRHQLSLPGDSAHDWIEARRQLTEEAQR